MQHTRVGVFPKKLPDVPPHLLRRNIIHEFADKFRCDLCKQCIAALAEREATRGPFPVKVEFKPDPKINIDISPVLQHFRRGGFHVAVITSDKGDHRMILLTLIDDSAQLVCRAKREAYVPTVDLDTVGEAPMAVVPSTSRSASIIASEPMPVPATEPASVSAPELAPLEAASVAASELVSVPAPELVPVAAIELAPVHAAKPAPVPALDPILVAEPELASVPASEQLPVAVPEPLPVLDLQALQSLNILALASETSSIDANQREALSIREKYALILDNIRFHRRHNGVFPYIVDMSDFQRTITDSIVNLLRTLNEYNVFVDSENQIVVNAPLPPLDAAPTDSIESDTESASFLVELSAVSANARSLGVSPINPSDIPVLPDDFRTPLFSEASTRGKRTKKPKDSRSTKRAKKTVTQQSVHATAVSDAPTALDTSSVLTSSTTSVASSSTEKANKSKHSKGHKAKHPKEHRSKHKWKHSTEHKSKHSTEHKSKHKSKHSKESVRQKSTEHEKRLRNGMTVDSDGNYVIDLTLSIFDYPDAVSESHAS